jgi:hypothetical protein
MKREKDGEAQRDYRDLLLKIRKELLELKAFIR